MTDITLCRPVAKLLVAAAFCASSASAATFDLTYEATGGVLSATIEGTLQADMNTVVVTGVQDFATFDSIAGPSLPTVISMDELIILSGLLDPVLTLDGSYLDFAAESADRAEAFLFAVGNYSSVGTGGNFFAASPAFGNSSGEPFQRANYSLTKQVSTIPLPASVVVLLSGIGAIAAFSRRRS